MEIINSGKPGLPRNDLIVSGKLQTLQNTMIRTILGFDKKKHVNMEHVRKEISMMSVNQMSV